MPPSNKREKERRKAPVVASAAKSMNSFKDGFESTSVKLPEGVSFFAPKKEGTYRLDILPYVIQEDGANPHALLDDDSPAPAGAWYYERTYFMHRDIGVNEDAYVCPRESYHPPQKCPICIHKTKLRHDPHTDSKLLDALEPKQRQLWNVIDLDDKKKGVQVWDVSWHLFGKQLRTKVQAKARYQNFFMPQGGLTVEVTLKEKHPPGYAKPFMEVAGIEMEPREDYDDDIVDKTVDLDAALVQVDFDKLHAIYHHLDAADANGHAPAAKGKPGKPTPKAREEEPEDEDDDQDEELELDEGEEDEAPPAPKKKGGPARKGEPTAADYGIEVGDAVVHGDYGECRVTRISKDGTAIYLETEDDGTVSAGPDEVEKAEASPPKKKAGKEPTPPPAKKDKRPEPDDDEDDDLDDEDDDLDDQDEDEDDLDEDLEDEDDEEPPARKPGKRGR